MNDISISNQNQLCKREKLDALAGQLDGLEPNAIDLRQKRILRLRACCLPLICVGVSRAHEPDMCDRCLADARAIYWKGWV